MDDSLCLKGCPLLKRSHPHERDHLSPLCVDTVAELGATSASDLRAASGQEGEATVVNEEPEVLQATALKWQDCMDTVSVQDESGVNDCIAECDLMFMQGEGVSGTAVQARHEVVGRRVPEIVWEPEGVQ